MWKSDLDHFVSLGFNEDQAREALQTTNGHREAAYHILVEGKKTKKEKKNDHAWRNEMEDDWIDGVGVLPVIAENRALHKSPIYLSITAYRGREDCEKYQFLVNVILKDGRKWRVMKTYSDFSLLKHAVPFTLCRKLKSKFPLPAACHMIFGGKQTTAFAEQRMMELNEWLRELSLNEKCMNCQPILRALHLFIEADEHGGPVGVTTTTARHLNPDLGHPNCAARQIGTSPLLKYDQFFASDKDIVSLLILVPALDERRLPLRVHQLAKATPVRVNVKKLHSYKAFTAANLEAYSNDNNDTYFKDTDAGGLFPTALPPNSKGGAVAGAAGEERMTREDSSDDVSSVCSSEVTESIVGSNPLKNNNKKKKYLSCRCPVPIDVPQMEKDYGRDRLVVQGRKLVGVHTDLQAVISLCSDIVEKSIRTAGKTFAVVAPPTPASPTTSATSAFAPGPAHDRASAGRKGARNDGVEGVTAQDRAEKDQDKKRRSSWFGSRTSKQKAAHDKTAEDKGTGWKKTSTTGIGSTAAAPASASTAASATTSASAASVCDPDTVDIDPTRATLDLFSKCALQLISRTESAYFSHSCLHDILDVGNSSRDPEFVPFVIVPESTLAEPIVLNFKVQEKKEADATTKRLSKRLSSPQMVTTTSSSNQTGGCDHSAAGAGGGAGAGAVRGAGIAAGGMGKVRRSFGGGFSSPPLAKEGSSGAVSSGGGESRDSGGSVDSRQSVAGTERYLLDWCVHCEAEAGTVYRVLNSSDMKPLLQLKVTYLTTLFGIPVYCNDVEADADRDGAHTTTAATSSGPAEDGDGPETAADPIGSLENRLLATQMLNDPVTPTNKCRAEAAALKKGESRQRHPSLRVARGGIVDMKIKIGGTYLIVEQLSTTTLRDWGDA